MTLQPATSRRSRLLLVISVALAALVLAPAASAAPPANDNWENALNIDATLGDVTGNVSEATHQADEPRTPLGAGFCDGREMVQTTWYRLIGNGGVISINTAGSSFDTVIAVYHAPAPPVLNQALPCNDDAAAGVRTSAVSFTSELGRTYLIQIGGCWSGGAACGLTSGFLRAAFTFGAPPRPDRDADGVFDDVDGCPDVKPTVDVNRDGCQDPPPDSDGDAIPDPIDRCPTLKATRDINHDGCQDPPAAIRAELSFLAREFRGRPRGSALRQVRLKGVPQGAAIRVTCSRCRTFVGVRPRRAFRGFSMRATRTGDISMTRLNRLLIPYRATLKIVVTAPERLGFRVTVQAVKRGRRIRSLEKESCLAVGSLTARVACPPG